MIFGASACRRYGICAIVGAVTVPISAHPPAAETRTASAPARSPILLSEFIYTHAPYPQAHASTIVELPDGTLAAAWFGGSGESRPDVQIWFARRGRADGRRPWRSPMA